MKRSNPGRYTTLQSAFQVQKTGATGLLLHHDLCRFTQFDLWQIHLDRGLGVDETSTYLNLSQDHSTTHRHPPLSALQLLKQFTLHSLIRRAGNAGLSTTMLHVHCQ